MYIIRSNRRNGIKDFVCDTTDDFKTLPSCQIGSSALVINGDKQQERYIKNSEDTWVLVGGASGGSSGGGGTGDIYTPFTEEELDNLLT